MLPAGCTATALKVTCDLGTIAPQTTVTRSIELAVPTEGTFVLLGSVTWSRPDPTPVDAQGQVTLSGVPPIGPVEPDLTPGDPAAARELPKPQTVSAAFVTTGLPRAGRCLRPRALRFKLRRPSGLAITQSDIYIGKQRVKRVTGAALGKTVVLRGLPRKRFTLIVVTTLREGGRLSGRRTFKPCR